jgi:NitT/TauT family transport system permease protein
MTRPVTTRAVLARALRKRDGLVVFVGQAAVVSAVIGAWWLAAELIFDPLTVPPPLEAFGAIPEVLAEPDFWPSVWLTMERSVLAFAIAAVVGMVLGVASARSPVARGLLKPILAGWNAFPKLLIYPVLVVIFGLGRWSSVSLGVGLAMFPITVNTAAGLSTVPRVLSEVAHVYGASKRQEFWFVDFRWAVPLIAAGLRTGFVFSLLSIVAGQYVLGSEGLGFLVQQYYFYFQVEQLFASVILIFLLVLMSTAVISKMEARLLRYQR